MLLSLLFGDAGIEYFHLGIQVIPTGWGRPLASGSWASGGTGLPTSQLWSQRWPLHSLVQCGTHRNPRPSAKGKRNAFGSICKNSPAINLSSSIWGSHNFLHSDKLLFISNVPEGNWPIAYFDCQDHYAEPGGGTQIQTGGFWDSGPCKTGPFNKGPSQMPCRP